MSNYPEKLLEHMKSFKYGLYKNKGIWYIQQPNSLEKTKLGVCHDFSLYTYDRLTKQGYKCKLIYISTSDVKATHSFVIYKNNNKEYWFEAAWGDYIGIHELKNSYNDVVKLWAKSENESHDDIAVNDNVDVNELLTGKNLTYEEYFKIVTEPFLNDKGNESMNPNDVNLKRVEWNYNDNKEFNKYIKIFIAMSKQMGKDMSVYDYDYHKEDTMQSIKEDLKKWNKSNTKVLLYFNSNDEEIGYVFLMDSMYETIRATWISELFVKPSFRNKGYGTTILTDVLNYLKEQKIQRAFLRVYEQNKGAKQLYERFGFTTFERVMGLGLENFKENQNIVYLDLNNPGKENMSIQQLSINSDKFNNIKTVAIYQPEAVNGLHIFPEIYKFIMEEIDRCSKKRSYLTMFSEMPSVDNIFNTSTFDIIRDKLRGTGTNLEVVDGKLTLNTNKFYFKEDTKVLKTLYKLQWDEKSYNTLKDVKIPEFINMINVYRPKYESIKEQVSQYTLLPSEIYPSTADQKLASANKKRLDGLFQIAKKIENLYENVYVDFVNSITEQLI